MARNIRRNLLKTFSAASETQEVELTHSVNHHALALVITADVDISGGASDGTVVDGGVADIVESVSVNHDGIDIVQPIPGKDLLIDGRLTTPRAPLYDGLAGGGIQTTSVAAVLPINFSPAFLANPYEVFLPAQEVNQQLRMYIKVRESAAAATALISGGDRTVAVTNISVKVVEVFSVSSLRPWYIPVLTVGFTESFTTALTDHAYRFRSPNRIVSQIFQYREADGSVADKINSATLRSGLQTWDRALPFDFLKSEQQSFFGGTPDPDPGTLHYLYADNGKLGTVLEPRYMGSDPRFEFDVSAPVSSGRLRHITRELIVKPGITLVEDV